MEAFRKTKSENKNRYKNQMWYKNNNISLNICPKGNFAQRALNAESFNGKDRKEHGESIKAAAA